MNRNQKIGIGCGAVGCLGLILIVVIGLALYLGGYLKNLAGTNRNRNYNVNINANSSPNRNSNANTATDSSSSTLSDDDKHKLFQAAGITKDSDLILRVMSKIGFESGTGDAYQQFSKEHFEWAMRNIDFMKTIDTPEKGRAYVESHIND